MLSLPRRSTVSAKYLSELVTKSHDIWISDLNWWYCLLLFNEWRNVSCCFEEEVDTTGSPGHRRSDSPNICADSMAAKARQTILNLKNKNKWINNHSVSITWQYIIPYRLKILTWSIAYHGVNYIINIKSISSSMMKKRFDDWLLNWIFLSPSNITLHKIVIPELDL